MSVIIVLVGVSLLSVELYFDTRFIEQQQTQQINQRFQSIASELADNINRDNLQPLLKNLQPIFLENNISSLAVSVSGQEIAKLNTSLPANVPFPASTFISQSSSFEVALPYEEDITLHITTNNFQVYQTWRSQFPIKLTILALALTITLLLLRRLMRRYQQQLELTLVKPAQLIQSQLHRNENALSKMGNIVTFGYWYIDDVDRKFHWLGELPALLGLANEELKSLSQVLEQVPESDRERLNKAIHIACEGDQELDIEFPIEHKNGTLIWVRAIGSCQFVENEPIWCEALLEDVSETYSSKHELQLRDFALNQSPDSIFTLDSQGYILSVNDTASRIFGFSRDEMVGQTVDLLNPKLDMNDWPRWWKMVKNQHHLTSFANNQSKDGRLFPVEVAASYFAHNLRELCILSVKDITERKKHEDEIRHLAYHDTLTNLPNRRLLLDRLQMALVSANRHQHIGALLFIDLDNFKKINDSQGHSIGDLVLKTLAERITTHLRAEDTVARIGGDEFVVLLPYLSDSISEAKQRAEDLANKLLSLVMRPIPTKNESVQVTASIGVVNFPNSDENDADKLISFADTAMYQAKGKGRNDVVYFQMSMAEDISRQINLESRLKSALDSEEFFLHFQPQYEGLDKLVGAEVLLRWHAPTYGLISPAEFVPILESSGLIINVGEWVMRQACEQLKRWMDQGIWHSGLTLGINISPVEFEQSGFVDQVACILAETGIPAHMIDIEITEGTVIRNIDQIIQTLTSLRNLGVKVSIDDFGTGYSSLTYLKRLPVDMVKIDQSFVKDVPGDDSAGAIINTIISMADHLNLDIIAEGIESLEQLHYLQNNGCKKFQGFFFHSPMVDSDFSLLLKEHLPD